MVFAAARDFLSEFTFPIGLGIIIVLLGVNYYNRKDEDIPWRRKLFQKEHVLDPMLWEFWMMFALLNMVRSGE